MDLKYLKNPIILGILGAVVTYVYLWWEDEKRYKKYPKMTKKSVGLLTPIIVGAIVWFIASSYFGTSAPTVIIEEGGKLEGVIKGVEKPPLVGPTIYKLANSAGPESVGSKSYHLVSKNRVRMPSADVFIDIAKF